MKRYKLTLRLEEDTIFTARSATVGAHQTLDYIPGAVLYGACASRLYNQLGSEQAFQLFHSGKVRFGNGLPLSPEHEATYPMPLIWHVKKGHEYRQVSDNHRLNPQTLLNPLLESPPKDTQLKQLREGYITRSGRWLKPATSFRMKTAIDPKTATAAEAQLFGYAALEAGQRFQAWLEIDDSISEDLAQQIHASLHGSIRLGRSRSAQYGTVLCQLSPSDEAASDQTVVNHGTQLVFWLLSDMALRDERGLPLLEPQTASLGLSAGSIDWRKTYLRFRHYSPYNAARKHYDQERQLIQQGSVISVTLDEAMTDADLLTLQTGIGDYRQQGLGQVLLNPDLLLKPLPCPAQREPTAHPPAPEPSDDKLVQWLQSQTGVSRQRSQTRAIAEQLIQELQQLYASASAYAAQPEGLCIGPGKTQWGRITAVGKQGNDPKALCKKLKEIVQFNEKHGKIEDEDWATATGFSDHRASFGDWLLHSFSVEMARPGDAVALLGRRADELIRTLESRSTAPTQEINQ